MPVLHRSTLNAAAQNSLIRNKPEITDFWPVNLPSGEIKVQKKKNQSIQDKRSCPVFLLLWRHQQAERGIKHTLKQQRETPFTLLKHTVPSEWLKMLKKNLKFLSDLRRILSSFSSLFWFYISQISCKVRKTKNKVCELVLDSFCNVLLQVLRRGMNVQTSGSRVSLWAAGILTDTTSTASGSTSLSSNLEITFFR